jgi:arylsulfatase A-like enzyme
MAVVAQRLARGIAAGLAAGVVWWVVECVANWALGGTIDVSAALVILGLDVAFGAVGGAIVALVSGAASAPALALALTVVYGALRVYEPPGMRAELLFLVVAPAAAFVAWRLAGRGREGALAFVQLSLLATAATVFGKAGITEVQSYFAQEEPSALTLVALLAGLPLAGVVADRVLALVVRRHALRLGLEVAAGAVALFVWGQPLPVAALDQPVAARPPAAPGAPDVILVSLDTTRADHMSTYGYARETSPNLTALARDALNFTEARSPAEWTVPGHASMLTGMYPSRHGAHYAGEWNAGPQIYGRKRVFPLADDRVTMAEVLAARGYRTGGFVANFANLYRGFGMAQGFEHYDDAPGVMLKPVPHAVRLVQRFSPSFLKRPFRSTAEIASAALRFLDRGEQGRPVFLFLNVLEPHQWVLPPAPFDRWAQAIPGATRLAQKGFFTHAIPTHLKPVEQDFVTATYDGQIAFMDAQLGEFIAALKARGHYENALIMVTADHGELLGEHDQVGHGGRMMYEGLLHVPMVVKMPGADHPRGEVSGPVQLVDLLPTVCAAVGAPVPDGVQGETLPHVDHEIVAEEQINPEFVAHYGEVYDRAMRVVYDRSWKLIATSKGERLLFDLDRDPGEAENLASREPDRTKELERRLEAAMSVMVSDARGGAPVD